MNHLLSGIVPWFGGHPDNLKRTVDSMRTVCDEVLVVHQTLFDSDTEIARGIADKVEVVDWNFVFGPEGYGGLPNKHGQSESDWFLLFGVGETLAEEYTSIRTVLRNSPRNVIWKCNHRNNDGQFDPNLWGRIWCPGGGVRWGGLIHEEAGGGVAGGQVLFRMLDTPKTPHPDPFVNECLKWMKLTSYDANYWKLLQSIDPITEDSSLRSFTNKWWVGFVRGARESLEAKQEKWKDFMEAGLSGDREAFFAAVRHRMAGNEHPVGCNFAPLGEPMTEGAL